MDGKEDEDVCVCVRRWRGGGGKALRIISTLFVCAIFFDKYEAKTAEN